MGRVASLHTNAKWLLVISTIFNLSIALSNTFVNVYLWKVDKTYGSIALYNLLLYIILPLTFLVSGFFAGKIGAVWTLRIGILWHVAFYALTLIGGEAVAKMPYILGIVMGCAAGMYWFSFNALSLRFTNDGKRDGFFGLNGVTGAVAGMLAPPTAGFLISREDRLVGPITGYHLVFALSLGLFVLATFVTTKIRVHAHEPRLRMSIAFSSLRHRWWRLLMVGCTAYGIREGVFMFLIGLLIYVSTQSEMRLGEFALMQSALSFVSFYVVGRIVRPRNRLKVLKIGALCMAGAALFFLLPIRPMTIVLYGCVLALVLPLFLVSLQGFVFDGISALSRASAEEEAEVGTPSANNEQIILREIFENVGRVIGILGFLILVKTRPGAGFVPTMAVGLGFTQLLTWFFLQKSGIEAVCTGSEDRDARSKVVPSGRPVWSMQNEEASRPPRGLRSTSRRSPR